MLYQRFNIFSRIAKCGKSRSRLLFFMLIDKKPPL
nr:MAG TPA: hypothetical protein [Caudoviricetes sp.]